MSDKERRIVMIKSSHLSPERQSFLLQLLEKYQGGQIVQDCLSLAEVMQHMEPACDAHYGFIEKFFRNLVIPTVRTSRFHVCFLYSLFYQKGKKNEIRARFRN